MPRPIVIQSPSEVATYTREARRRGQRIGFVPTMGYLHEGHLSLVRAARQSTDLVIASIYVNPTQFGPGEDLDSYPRDLESDLARLGSEGVACVFTPSNAEMYAPGHATYVAVERLTQGLCGIRRPVHFQGVTTVVTKLLCIVRPHVAVFGQKDYQQLTVIRRMVRDLFLDVEIVGSPTIRETDGLAMSSRNAYLNEAQRAAAPALYTALTAMRAAFEAGERDVQAILRVGRLIIEGEPALGLDYLELIDPDDLHSLTSGGEVRLPEAVHAAVAAFAGRARLIDNARLGG